MIKNRTKGYVILGLLFALLSTIAFIVPTIKTATFWVAYVFTVVAFLAQIVTWKISFKNGAPLKSKFLGVPIVYIGILYLVVQILALFIFMLVPALPTSSSIITCTIIAAISCICMVAADTGKAEIQKVEDAVRKKVFYIQALQADVELLADDEKNVDVRTNLTQLAEKIRYSDPMSNERLKDLEDKISTMVSELKTSPDKITIVNEISKLLDERNKKCKIMK